MRDNGLFRTAILCLVLVLTSTGNAEEMIEDTLGEHIVVAGENLEIITKKYLGDGSLWRENWRLNPGVQNPHKLRIGQRLKVIKERRITVQSAEIRTISNRVEKNLQRSDWKAASRGDDLQPQDGVRTLGNASAQLQFNDNSSLRMTEYSQIFLESHSTTLHHVDTGRIEVVEGTAELIFEPITARKTEIELVSGGSVTRPQPSADGGGRLKTSADKSGGARVMVYSGFSSVSAGGETVQVGSGLGTAVPETGPPGKPERLLGSPRGLSPVSGARWPVANGWLSWEAVKLAASYIVEVCLDIECAGLVARGSGLLETRWLAQVDRAGPLFWRVTAVSKSGLEGYPSRALPLAVLSTRIDTGGPVSVVIPVGFQQTLTDGRLLVGGAARLALAARDDAVDVRSIEYRWNKGSWLLWDGNDLELAGIDLPAVLYVRATDTLDKQGDVVSVHLLAMPNP